MKKDDNSGVSIKQIMITTLFLCITTLGGINVHRIVYNENVDTIQNIEIGDTEDLTYETALVENTEEDVVYTKNINFLAGKVVQISGDKVDFSEKVISRGNFVRNQTNEIFSEKNQNKLLDIVLNEIKELGDNQELVEDITSGISKDLEVSGEEVTIENDNLEKTENVSNEPKDVKKVEVITEPVPPTNYIKTIDVKATAYCLCKKCCGKSPSSPNYGVTASGLKIVPGNNMKVIASDPSLIPLGSEVYIEGLNGAKDYGYAVAADTGSAIKNKKIDLYMDTHQMALNWGVKNVRVYILDK